MKRPVSEICRYFPGPQCGCLRLWVVPVIAFAVLLGGRLARGETPIKIVVDASSPGYTVPADFAGLGFETKSVLPNTYGVSGHFFSPDNTQLITLFRNMGVREIRVGGGTVDGSGRGEQCTSGTPDEKDIDNLFEFAKLAGVKVIYSVRLLNMGSCNDPDLPEKDAKIAKYVWDKYREELDSFSIGNEPDVREFHTYPGHPMDPLIYEAKVGVAGSAYRSYFAQWKKFAEVVHQAVPDAKFSGPETAVSDTSSYTPDRTTGISWTQKFPEDVKAAGLPFKTALQHHYVWGSPQNTTTQEAIDDMLSDAWDTGTEVGMQPARNGKTVPFHPYPYLYRQNFAALVANGVPYRMTEANDCLHGVFGASDGYAAALWSLDYLHWWAAHGAAGINFHNNPWIPTDTVVPDPNPCPKTGCTNYRVSPKGYGIKAFDLGSHGSVMPVSLSNPGKVNLTAYAVGTSQDVYVTIINKTHSTTHDVTNVDAVIDLKGFHPVSAESIALSNGEPGNAATMNATLGGATITNSAPWEGKWTPVKVRHGVVHVPVPSTSAVVVKLHAGK